MSATALRPPGVVATGLFAAALAAASGQAAASSHREAPFIATQPQVDATDFYMFRSYEPGREGYVTLIANYLPLQDPYGGPNFFKLDQNAVFVDAVHFAFGVEFDVDYYFAFDLRSIGNGRICRRRHPHCVCR